MRWLTLWLIAASALGQDLVPWFDNPIYTRDEPTSPPWWVANNLQPSNLYSNGVWISSDSGTNDLNMVAAWALQPVGAKVGMMDMTAHGDRTYSIITQASPYSEVFYDHLQRWDAEDMATGITNCVDQGCQVIVFSWGFSTPSDTLSNALLYALESNVVICCSTPNAPGNLDNGTVDYPYEWRFPHCLGVNSTDRNGQPYWSGTGTNSVGAPGRNIVAAGTYASGTSWACPIAASCVALLIGRLPGLSAQAYVSIIKGTATEGRINILAALQPPPAPTNLIIEIQPEEP